MESGDLSACLARAKLRKQRVTEDVENGGSGMDRKPTLLLGWIRHRLKFVLQLKKTSPFKLRGEGWDA